MNDHVEHSLHPDSVRQGARTIHSHVLTPQESSGPRPLLAPQVSHRPRRIRARDAPSRVESGHPTVGDPGIRGRSPAARTRILPEWRSTSAPLGDAAVVRERGSRGCRPSVIKRTVSEIEVLRAWAQSWRGRPVQPVMLASVRRIYAVSGVLLSAPTLATGFSNPVMARNLFLHRRLPPAPNLLGGVDHQITMASGVPLPSFNLSGVSLRWQSISPFSSFATGGAPHLSA